MKKIIFIQILLCCSFLSYAQLYNKGAIISIKSGATLRVNGNLTNDSGSSLNNNGTLNVKGDLTNHQTMPTANNGTLNFVGTSQQNLNGTATFFTKNVGFNTHSLTLNDTLKIDGTANFQNGIVSGSTNAMPIVFTQNANISTTNLPTDNSHINGVVLKQGTGVFAFPIGNATKYQGIEVNLSENSSGMLAAYAAQDAGTAPFAAAPNGSLPLYAYNNSEHWLLTPLDAASGTVKVTWDSYNDLETALITTNEARVAHLVNNEWRNEGGNNNSGTVNSGDVTSNTLNSWGKFTIGKECDAPTVFEVTGGGYVCENYDGTGLFIGLNNSQIGISYQLKRDDVNVGNAVIGTGAAISFGDFLIPGTYTVVATSTRTGCKAIMRGSAIISIDETLAAIDPYFVPFDYTISCSDVIPAVPVVIATSSCSTITMTQTSTKGTNAAQCNFYSYTIKRTWTATDKRNNTATVSQVITVQDNTAPVIVPLANITVTEGTIPTTVTTTDCMASPIVTFTDVKVTNTPPPCKNYSYTLSRTWKVTDACGNSSTATQTIKAEGIILTCPSDKTIYTNSDGVNNYNCNSLATAAMGVAPTFTDGCDAAVLRYTITGVTTGTGNGSVAGIAFAKGVSKITYNLVSNVSDQCSLNLTVLDNEGPKITLTPTVVLDACTMPSPIPDTYKPTVLDNCTGTNTLEVMSDVLADVSGCSTKTAAQKYTKLLTRTWKATDENGNTSTAVQRIYLRDNVPPITVCKNVTVNIGSTNITLPVSSLNNGSNDNCTAANALTFVGCMNTTTACTNFGANLTLKASMIPAGQNQTTITVRVKARDACGNETATPVSTIITLKRLGTMNNTTNGSENSMAIQDTESSIPAEDSTVPTAHGEMKCYPSPFTEDLNIQYNLTENVETVTLKVYDTQGRLVKTMEQEAQLVGFYQVRWNLSDLASGMYHVCLELNGKCTKMERVIMMK